LTPDMQSVVKGLRAQRISKLSSLDFEFSAISRKWSRVAMRNLCLIIMEFCTVNFVN
jgi:hypothetical protein